MDFENKHSYNSFKTSIKPCVFGALLATAGLNLVGQLMGGKKQERAIGRAQAGQEALQERILEETRPQRELALEQGRFLFGQQQQLMPAQTQATLQTLPLLQEDVLRQPGSSQLFQRALSQQTGNIMSNLGAFGLEDSSVAGRAVGEATAGLTAQDIENVRQARFQLAGFGQAPQGQFGSATAGLGTAANIGSNIANLGVQQGAVQAGGVSSAFGTAAQLPLLQALQPGLFGGGQNIGSQQSGFMAPQQGNTLTGTDFSSLIRG